MTSCRKLQVEAAVIRRSGRLVGSEMNPRAPSPLTAVHRRPGRPRLKSSLPVQAPDCSHRQKERARNLVGVERALQGDGSAPGARGGIMNDVVDASRADQGKCGSVEATHGFMI